MCQCENNFKGCNEFFFGVYMKEFQGRDDLIFSFLLRGLYKEAISM